MTLCVLGSITLCTVTFLGIRSRFVPPTPKLQVTKGKAVSVYVDDGTGVYRANEDGTFPTDGYVLNTELSACANGGVLSQNPEDKTISLSVGGSDQCHVYFDKEKFNVPQAIIAIQNGTEVIGTKGALTTSFDSPASTVESAGVYELADEGGTSYYFRGPVENNYVKFGKWMDSSDANYGKDMYWRIIRVNGDGSLRMIYAGTSAHANDNQGTDTFIGTSAFNTSYNDAKYVGYMYSPAGTTASTASSLSNPNEESSTIKGVLETWYDKNLKDYDEYISKDAVFCYDRSTPGKSATGWDSDTGLGYGTNATAYGATARTGVWNSATTASAPNFVCSQNNDKFTSKNSTAEIGNKKLEYPVGLISADEILAAGSGKYGTSSDYYLKRSSWYWLGSPYYSGSGNAVVFRVNPTGNLYSNNVFITAGRVAPVINLSAEYAKTLVGEGTASSPYHS